MMIEGVRISAYLDAFVHHAHQGEGRLGGIHLQLSLGKPEAKRDDTKAKRERAGQYTAALLLRHIQTHFPDLGVPRHDLTTFANIRRGNIWIAPENHKLMFNRVDAAARMIASVWDDIAPPADFDPTKAKFIN
jgi:uncharacterized protein (UPF0254 family)